MNRTSLLLLFAVALAACTVPALTTTLPSTASPPTSSAASKTTTQTPTVAVATSIPEPEPYQFDVVGHLYPGADEYFSHSLGGEFRVFTGDTIFEACIDWPGFDAAIGNDEHHIAPGNHDVDIECPEQFDFRYPDRSYTFRQGPDAFVILDGNSHNWNIQWGQQTMLADVLADPTVRNTFVFIHQVTFDLDPELGGWLLPNSYHGWTQWMTFTAQIRPLLEASPSDVHFFVGDVGNKPQTEWRRELNGVTYYGAGLGVGNNSGYLAIGVGSDGRVWPTFQPLVVPVPGG